MSSTFECGVCMEDRSANEEIECFKCGMKTCQACTKRYLVSSLREAHCMGCQTGWTNKFLLGALPKTWVTGTKDGQYRDSRKKILLEREKARIPDTMARYIPIVKEERAKREKGLRSYRKNFEEQVVLYQYRAKLMELEIALLSPKSPDDMKRLKTECKALRKIITGFRIPPTSTIGPDTYDKMIVDHEYRNMFGKKKKKASYEVLFVCPCPGNDCKGLIRKKSLECSICEKVMCSSCRTFKEDGHVCDPDLVVTVKLLKSDSKPCPKCASPIMKVSGCDQMFCTQCHVAFSWRTGELATGTIHNPHAIEWSKRNGGSIGRNLNEYCGGIPNVKREVLNEVEEEFWKQTGFQKPEKKCRSIGIFRKFTISSIIQTVGHTEAILEKYKEPSTMKLEAVRIEYLFGEIDEKEWTQRIFNHERKRQRRVKMVELFNLYRNLATERFQALDKEDIKPKAFMKDMLALRAFINEVIREETLPLGVKNPPQITQEYSWDA